ncbi:MAG: glutamate 5-kinase [Propionibacteriaceae bacterium]|nr:glutamate 5-kinase [Propionibacteriaceae bacterium]
MRTDLAGAHRVVVKIGSSSLTTAQGGLNLDQVSALVDALAAARASGRQIVLVSSGAIAAGLAPLGFRRRPKDLASQQAAASVGQGLLVAHYARLFAAHDTRVGQVLLTVQDVTRRATYRNALSTMSRLLRLNAIPIVNENDTVATHEIRFGDNDRLAALVAHLVRAEALVLLSDVDGLYTGHPDDPGSEFVARVDDLSSLRVDTSRPGKAGVGTGGMTTKLQAAEIATSAGIPVVLTRPARLSEALAGDPVDLVGPDGRVLARGLTNYADEELHPMLGRTTRDLVSEFGDDFEREVVHRDQLIVLSRYQQDARRIEG